LYYNKLFMKKLYSLLLFLVCGFPVFSLAQTTDTIDRGYILYDPIETDPIFPGGQDSLFMFLKANIVYPKAAKKQKIEGNVLVSFVVEKEGSITNVKVVRGVDSLLDAEAIRVVKLMPKWIPATQNAEPVRVMYRLPIVFSLE